MMLLSCKDHDFLAMGIYVVLGDTDSQSIESFRYEDVLVLFLEQTDVSLVISLSSHILTLSVQSILSILFLSGINYTSTCKRK